MQVSELRSARTNRGGSTSVLGMDDNDWALINHLRGKPHPNLPPVDFDPELPLGVGEVLQEARVVQHLLDLAGIPRGKGYSADIDARVVQLLRHAQRLDRIEAMHQPDRNCDGHGGNSGYCVECEWAWPCATAEVASGERDDEL